MSTDTCVCDGGLSPLEQLLRPASNRYSGIRPGRSARKLVRPSANRNTRVRYGDLEAYRRVPTQPGQGDARRCKEMQGEALLPCVLNCLACVINSFRATFLIWTTLLPHEQKSIVACVSTNSAVGSSFQNIATHELVVRLRNSADHRSQRSFAKQSWWSSPALVAMF